MPLQAKPMGGGAKSLPPANKKYANVKARLDTGCNQLKIKSSESKANARFHRGENFRRLKVSTLVALLQDLQVDMLLLDLRDEDAYMQYHLQGAVNYPIRLLSRQCNPFTTEILAYVNAGPQKIIVLCDLDEHLAFTAGNSFYEKGVDNVFIVSGGLKEVLRQAPELCEGPCIPRAPTPSKPHASWQNSPQPDVLIAVPRQGYTPTGSIRPRTSTSRMSMERQPQHWKQ
ncbi:hypothetical protein ABBQ32_001280 [Trebouxia sp. C0010 RCD-2024]